MPSYETAYPKPALPSPSEDVAIRVLSVLSAYDTFPTYDPEWTDIVRAAATTSKAHIEGGSRFFRHVLMNKTRSEQAAVVFQTVGPYIELSPAMEKRILEFHNTTRPIAPKPTTTAW